MEPEPSVQPEELLGDIDLVFATSDDKTLRIGLDRETALSLAIGILTKFSTSQMLKANKVKYDVSTKRARIEEQKNE